VLVNNELALQTCTKCGGYTFSLGKTPQQNNGHVKVLCASCGQHLAFFKQSDPMASQKKYPPKKIEDVMPSGKHKGTAFKDLPREYLEWAKENHPFQDVRVVCARVYEMYNSPLGGHHEPVRGNI
jgi:uncharacterized protein (DUF3820 family)